tara:strand:+ start:386 stop:502 length:117 start_codon:yes stop_codon:yes gene_type:complete
MSSSVAVVLVQVQLDILVVVALVPMLQEVAQDLQVHQQ